MIHELQETQTQSLGRKVRMSYQYPSSVGDFDSNWSCVVGVWNFISMSTTPVKDPDCFFHFLGAYLRRVED